MGKLLGWWPVLVAILWLKLVEIVAGPPAAFFSAVTALAVCLLAFWEAGKDRDPPNPIQ